MEKAVVWPLVGRDTGRDQRKDVMELLHHELWMSFVMTTGDRGIARATLDM